MTSLFPIQWHITDECDQRCIHCYIYSKPDGECWKTVSREQMDEVIEQANELADTFRRKPYFYITGGDPILHPDFWHLAEMLHEDDAYWCLMGNPFHLTSEVCQRLKSLGCRKYQLSLDGLRETHDHFRMPGSFDKTLEAIKLLKEAGIWANVMSTVSSTNIDEIPDLIDLAAEHDVDVFAFGRYCPTTDQNRDEFHVEPLRYREFLKECQRRIDKQIENGTQTTFQKKDHLWTLLDYEEGRFEIPEDHDPSLIYDGCHCGSGHVTILPDGDIYACRRMDSKVGNIFEAGLSDGSSPSSLKEIFLSKEMDAYRNFDAFEKCERCELKSYCRGCPAVTAGYTGSMYAPDPQCWKEIRA